MYKELQDHSNHNAFREFYRNPYHVELGYFDEAMNNIRYLIVNKDFDALEKILFSQYPLSRCLSAATLEYLMN